MKGANRISNGFSWLLEQLGLAEWPCEYQVLLAATIAIPTVSGTIYFLINSKNRDSSKGQLFRWLSSLTSGPALVFLWYTVFHCEACINQNVIFIDDERKYPVQGVSVVLSTDGIPTVWKKSSDEQGWMTVCIPGNLQSADLEIYHQTHYSQTIPVEVKCWSYDLPDTIYLQHGTINVPIDIVDEEFIRIEYPLRVELVSPSNDDMRLTRASNGFWYAKLEHDTLFELEIFSDEYINHVEPLSVLYPSDEVLTIPLTRR